MNPRLKSNNQTNLKFGSIINATLYISNEPNANYLKTRNSKAQMVLAKGLKGNFLNNVLVDGSWHFDFLNDGLGIGNLQMKIMTKFVCT